MTIDPDYLIERKHYLNQLKKWKMLSILAILGLVAIMVIKFKGNLANSSDGTIALIRVNDMIVEDKKRDQLLVEIKNDENVKALVVYIDSPGGTIVGSERAYKLIRSVADKKPVVSVLGTLATSGGYMLALAGDHIISHEGTLTGSIGVILQTSEVTELAKKIGIQFNNFKSGEFKASPNFSEKLTPAVNDAIMLTIDDMYNFFVGLVIERRGIKKEDAFKIADGRVYSGRQALGLKLVDSLGTLEDAKSWLVKEKGLSADLTLVDVSPKQKMSILDGLLENFHDVIFNKLRKGASGAMSVY